MLTPADLAAAYRALSPAERAAFALEIGLASRTHAGTRRTKNGLTAASRRVAYAREGYRCYWCGCSLAETGAHLDHLIHARTLAAFRAASGVDATPGIVVRGELAQFGMVVASCPTCNETRPRDDAERAATLRYVASADYASVLPRAGWAGATGSAEDAAAFAAVKRASSGIRPRGPASEDF